MIDGSSQDSNEVLSRKLHKKSIVVNYSIHKLLDVGVLCGMAH